MHINKVYGYPSKGDHSILENVKGRPYGLQLSRVSTVRREALGFKTRSGHDFTFRVSFGASVSSRLGKVCVSLVMRPISVVPSSLGTSQIKQIGGGIQYSEF